MLKDITLGQFFPGNTIAHRLDPRTKLILVVVYIVALFQTSGWISYIAVTAATAGCMAASKIKPGSIFKGLKPMLFIIALTALLNIFYTEGTPVPRLDRDMGGHRARVPDGAAHYPAHYRNLSADLYHESHRTDRRMELLLKPLKKIKVPVHEMTMMMSMALRFIPTLIEETDKIMSAQKARGADFETGSLIERAKALLPVLVPLFVSAFRRADELAVAMESRCYHGGEGRTSMKHLQMQGIDWAALIVGAAFLAGIIVLKKFGL